MTLPLTKSYFSLPTLSPCLGSRATSSDLPTPRVQVVFPRPLPSVSVFVCTEPLQHPPDWYIHRPPLTKPNESTVAVDHWWVVVTGPRKDVGREGLKEVGPFPPPNTPTLPCSPGGCEKVDRLKLSGSKSTVYVLGSTGRRISG